MRMVLPDNRLEVTWINIHSLVNLLTEVNKPGHRCASLVNMLTLVHNGARGNVQVLACNRFGLIRSQKNCRVSYITGCNQLTKRRAAGKLLPRLVNAYAPCLGLCADDPLDPFTFNGSRRDGIDANIVRPCL